MKKSYRFWFTAAVITIGIANFPHGRAAHAQPAGAATQRKPAEIQVAGAPIATRVLVQSPAETVTDLQVICLFEASQESPLKGALLETNEKLKGLLEHPATLFMD